MTCAPEIEANSRVRTLRLPVKAESYSELTAAAAEVNTCWNYANEVSYRAARPFFGKSKKLSGYDLDRLATGAAACFTHIGSATIQRVNAGYATRRRQFNKLKLRWRKSRGAKRSLAWIPFKAEQIKRHGKGLRFCGKSIRAFEYAVLERKTGPAGLDMQVVSTWICSECGGDTHDRNVNSSKHIVGACRLSTSVGNGMDARILFTGIDVPKWKCHCNHLTKNGSIRNE